MLSRALCQAAGRSLGQRLLRQPSILAAAQTRVQTEPARAAATAQGHGAHFKLERLFAASMVPLFPAAYFIHGGVMDLALAVAVSLHVHWGMHSVIEDYARPLVVGPAFASVANKLAYLFSILLLAGLLNFNYNDVGMTKGMQMIWSL